MHQVLGGLRLDPDSATLVLEFWLGKNSEEESNSMRKFIWKVTEVEEVSKLGCVGSGNKTQRQKKLGA